MKLKLPILIALLIASLAILASCGDEAAVSNSDWTADPYTALVGVTSQLEVKDLPEGGSFFDSKVTDEESENFLDAYTRGVTFKDANGESDISCVESFGLYIPAGDKATNIGIMKAKSQEDVAAVKELAERVIANVQTKFKSYIPDQDKIAQKTKVETNGLYVYYVVAQDVNKIADMLKVELAK